MVEGKVRNGDGPTADGEIHHGAAGPGPRVGDGAASVLMDDTGVADTSKVQFIPKDDETLKSDGGPSTPGEFVGLRKEELAKYASDPYWVRVRIVLLVLFALTWLAMLGAAIAIIALAPGCPPRPRLDWWDTAVVYQVHPLSFKDTTGKGYGDIKGLIEKKGYLKEDLKVTAVLLGPMYPSPHQDYGYDVSDYRGICGGHFGSLTDFDELVTQLHKAGIKVILDFVPNHTSNKSRWFKSPSANQSNYYIWAAANDTRALADGTRVPPNNWQSLRGGPAWSWNETRQMFYYHTFLPSEPDLNLRDADVIKEIDDALTFWLDRKVDGFRLVGVQHLVKPENLDAPDDARDFQPESYDLVAHWRALIDAYSEQDGKSKSRPRPRLLIADVTGTPAQTIAFSRGNGTAPGAHVATNKALNGLKAGCGSDCIFKLISDWTKVSQSPHALTNWQVGNYETSRVVSRYGNDAALVNVINVLLLTLGGTAFTFYGDELGMKDVNLTAAADPATAQKYAGFGQLTPMQWNNSEHAGFMGSPKNRSDPKQPWMPIADNFHETNVQTQFAHGAAVNHVGVFQRLVALRRASESLQWGALRGLAVQDGVLLYLRDAEGFAPMLVALNFGRRAATINFHAYERAHLEPDTLPAEARIATSTFNFAERASSFTNGTTIALDRMVFLKPTEGLVLTWAPDAARMGAGKAASA